MAGRVVSINFLGNTRELEAALERAGLVAEKQAERFQASANAMGRAAAEQAKAAGASADEQAAAAGKASAAFTEAAAKMSAAQKAAGTAAARAAQVVGASLDEQSAAFQRAVATQAEYEAATKRAAEQQARMGASVDALGAKMAGLGKRTVVGGIAGFGVAAYEGVKGFSALNAEMEKIHTQAGASQAEVVRMTRAAENMAGSVATGPEDLAKGLYHIESAGFRGAEALKILRAAAEGARVGGANLEDVTNALNAAVVSGISGVQNYGQAMGALNAIVGSGDMRMQDLADALGTGLLAPMRTYGLSLRDVGAALATFGDNNIRGAEAATKLTSAVRIMAAPSHAASKALGVINLSTLQLANDMRSGGLLKALGDLKRHLIESGATASQQGLIIARAFGGRQSTGVQVLLNQLDRVKQKYGDVGEGAHKFGSDVAAYMHTPQAEWHKFTATVQELADKFGQFLIPRLQAAGSAISTVIHWFERHKVAAQALAGVITGVLGTAIAAFAYGKAVAFVNATKTMVSGLVGLAEKMAGVAATIAAKFGLIDAAAQTSATEVATADARIEAANATAGGSFLTLSGAASSATGTLGAKVAAGAAAVGEADATIEAANATAAASFAGFLGPIAAATAALVVFHNQISQAMQDMVDFATGAHLKGHVVPTPGQATKAWAHAEAKKIYTSSNFDTQFGVGTQLGKPGVTTVGINPYSAPTTAGTGLSHKALQSLLGGGGSAASGGSHHAASGLSSYSPSSFAVASLMALGIVPTPQNVRDFTAWEQQEGGNWHNTAKFNPLNTTMPEPGYSKTGAQGNIGSYTSWAQGLKATVDTLKLPAYAGIIGALKGGASLGGFSAAVGGSPWGTGHIGTSGLSLSPSEITKIETSLGGHGMHVTAASTSAIPTAVATMLSTALSLVGTRYTHGGGHGGWDPVAELKKIGVDCSGFVSAVLHGGGVKMPGPLTTSGLPSVLAKGKGQFVTVYDRENGAQAHTIIDILGKYFESGGNSKYNPSGGVSQLSAAQAAGELSGGGFHAYHPRGLGSPFATVGQLKALGISAQASTPEGQATAAQQLAAAIKKYNDALKKAAGSILSSYHNLEQSGTTKNLEKALGVSTGAGISGRLHSAIEGLFGMGPNARGWVRGGGFGIGGFGSAAGFHNVPFTNASGMPTSAGLSSVVALITHAQSGSSQEKAFASLVDQLRASHSKAMHELADRLVAEHKHALATLAQELYAQQISKDAEELNAQASGIKDQTTAAQDGWNSLLAINRAKLQQQTDWAQAEAQSINDMAAYVRDKFAGIAEAIQDATQAMADSSDAIVQGIQDQTQIKVDILGERGLFGLNLIAQQLKVQYDQDKAFWDQQIAIAKQNLDAVTAQWHQAVSNAQLNVDQVQMQQDANVALAQQTYDTTQIAQLGRIGAAQAHSDSVAMHDDTAQMLAQIHVDLLANAPKAQQDMANAFLAFVTGKNASDQAAAGLNLANVTGNAQGLIDSAAASLAGIQGAAAAAIANANSSLATITGQATTAINTAQQGVQAVTGQAGVALATDQGNADVAGAQASTQFAGTGTVVNIYGVPANDASAVGDAVSWVARTQIGLAG